MAPLQPLQGVAFLFLRRGGRVWWVWVVPGFLGKWGGREGDLKSSSSLPLHA